MRYSQLGNTGYRVSKICFGSLTLGPLCAALTVEQGAELLLDAFRRGVNFIDTAEQYQTYPYLRAALDQYAEAGGVVVASKTFAVTDEQAAWALEDARLALRRDKMDIMLLHEVRDQADFTAREGAWRLLSTAKANGVIGALGLSTHSAVVAAWAALRPDVDVLHVMLNCAGIGILDGGVAEMLAAIRLAKQNGKGVYTMKAIGGGALMHRAKEALEWAFAQPELDAIAVGCKDRAELATNVAWLAGEDPPEANQVKLLDRNIAFDKEPRCHGCGACTRRCASGAMTMDESNNAVWNKSLCLYCGYCIAACPWFCLSFC